MCMQQQRARCRSLHARPIHPATQGECRRTANKELIATHGAELFAMARAAGVDLLFEAAVAGGIPLPRSVGTIRRDRSGGD